MCLILKSPIFWGGSEFLFRSWKILELLHNRVSSVNVYSVTDPSLSTALFQTKIFQHASDCHQILSRNSWFSDGFDDLIYVILTILMIFMKYRNGKVNKTNKIPAEHQHVSFDTASIRVLHSFFYLIALDYIFFSPQQQLGCISNSLTCNYEASRPFLAAPEWTKWHQTPIIVDILTIISSTSLSVSNRWEQIISDIVIMSPSSQTVMTDNHFNLFPDLIIMR